MEDHEAIPILRPSHRRALDFFNRNEFRQLSYGLPKKIDLNALDSLRELEDKSVRSQLKFVGDPKEGTLKRSDKQKDNGIQSFPEVESLPELEALGGIVTDSNGYAYALSKIRRKQPEKGARKTIRNRRNRSKKAGSVQAHRFENVKHSALQSLRIANPADFTSSREINGEVQNFSATASMLCDDALNTSISNMVIATEPNSDEEPLPDINSFSDITEVLALFKDQL